MKAAPRLDRRADDHELGPPFRSDAGHFLSEAPRAGANDLAAHTDSIGGRNRGGQIEPLPEGDELAVEVRVDRQLALEHGRCDEHDSRAAVGGEPAGEVDRVLGLGVVEQRDDDGAIRDRTGPAREAPRATVEEVYVRESHRISW